MKKAPKMYACTQCGFVSDKFKRLKFPTMSFATCFKCRGRLIERPEWLGWLQGERDRQINQAKEYNNGYILGQKVT